MHGYFTICYMYLTRLASHKDFISLFHYVPFSFSQIINPSHVLSSTSLGGDEAEVEAEGEMAGVVHPLSSDSGSAATDADSSPMESSLGGDDADADDIEEMAGDLDDDENAQAERLVAINKSILDLEMEFRKCKDFGVKPNIKRQIAELSFQRSSISEKVCLLCFCALLLIYQT